MSGGEKRLAAIAGVLAMRPEVIAFDEPTSDLDPVHAARVEGLIEELRRKGESGLVLSTHDLDLAGRIADRVAVLKRGSVIANGPPRDIFYDADLLAGAGLIEPRVVRLWREVCRRTGRDVGARPITEAELVAALADQRRGLRPWRTSTSRTAPCRSPGPRSGGRSRSCCLPSASCGSGDGRSNQGRVTLAAFCTATVFALFADRDPDARRASTSR